MKKKKSTIVFLVLAALALCVTAGAQTRQKKTHSQPAARSGKSGNNPDMQHEMQNAIPGVAHSRLAKLAGDYTTVGKFFAEPGATPMEFNGEAKLSVTLDGRFLIEEDSGTFAGQPSKGFRMVGYNNASKRYEGIWTYTMSTAIMTLNGTSADGGKTVSFAASFDNEGGVKEKLSIVVRQIDDDHFAVDLRGAMPDEKPGPRLETTYTRKK